MSPEPSTDSPWFMAPSTGSSDRVIELTPFDEDTEDPETAETEKDLRQPFPQR